MTLSDYDSLMLPDFMEPNIAEEYLAEHLRQGTVALMLGAGVSVSTGLPRWNALVEACEAEVGITPPSSKRSARELMGAIDGVKRRLRDFGREDELLDIVRSHLYPQTFLDNGAYPDTVLQDRMLIALGTMVMSSSRGSVSQVITLNFDDLLEWYLQLHGFTTQVISDYPALLRGDVDVTVLHPHGFLPLMTDTYSKTSWLVLSHKELVNRLSDSESKWATMLENTFLSKCFLAIGTSMQDLDVELLLAKARRAGRTGPLGFLIAPKSANPDHERDLLEAGIVPVPVDSNDHIPDFLLGICKKAARFAAK